REVFAAVGWRERKADDMDAGPADGAAIDPELAKDLGYSGTQTAKVVGISYRQLDYWARTDLIRPSITDAAGSGSRRRYSYRNLLELKVVKNLLDAGIRLEQVREVFAYMQDELGEDVTTANLVVNGNQPVLVRSGAEIVDLLQNGQGVLNILPLSGVKEELDEAIVDLFPAQADTLAAEIDSAAGAL
ncbi:MAG: MerR family transcriptional regulator, partial [Acidimicrobiales bacterium]